MAYQTQYRSDKLLDVLLVEDNPGEIRLVQEAFTELDTETSLRTVSNGRTAIELLTDQTTSESVSLPDLALIDLNVPQKDGCEVLEAIRDDPHIQALPVVMLTSSDSQEDIARCYDAHANAYLTKPTDPDEFIAQIQTVAQFWFEQAQLPPIPA